jgi:Uncharacterized protein conserved in cyanobacteria
MAMPAIRRRWTAADVRDLTREDGPWPRYELIDGELLVTPAPGNRHQLAVGELHALLRAYLERVPVAVVLFSPSDVELKPDTVVQPDVYIVPADTPNAREIRDWTDATSLLLAAEVLSPSSFRTDHITKRDFYLANGVEEYWIIDLDARVFERWRASSETPEVLRDRITWSPGGRDPLSIELPDWFARIDRIHDSLPRRFK